MQRDGDLVTLTDYVSAWLPIVARTRAPSTFAGYERAMRRQWLETALAPMDVGAIRRRNVRQAVEFILHTQAIEGAAVRTALIALSACFTKAVRDELVDANPCHRAVDDLLPRRKTPPIPLAFPELLSFLVAAKIVAPAFHDHFLQMAYTGTRLGETLALQWADVDWERRTARIARSWRYAIGPVKNDLPRTVDLCNEMMAMLRTRIEHRASETWVYPSSQRDAPYDPSTIERAMRAVKDAAEIRKPWTPHTLRHTYATLLIQAGAKLWYVQTQLGHSSIQITKDLYGHHAVSTEHEVDLLDGLRAPKPLLHIVPQTLRHYRRLHEPSARQPATSR